MKDIPEIETCFRSKQLFARSWNINSLLFLGEFR